MAKTVIGTAYDGVRGAKLEFGTFTVAHSTLAAQAAEEVTASFDGVQSGDIIFVNPRSLTAGLNYRGSRVSASDVVAVALRNDSTQSVAAATTTYEYLVVKTGGDA